MTFKPGDQVLLDGKGPYTIEDNPNSRNYPLYVNDLSFTTDGRFSVKDSIPRLTLYEEVIDTSITKYPLGKVQTLDNGIQIYHPNEGQPFQLTPTHKELI